MKRLMILILVSIFILIVLPASAAVQNPRVNLAHSPASPSTSSFTFYAIYDRLADDDNIGAHLTHSAMSGDGEKLIFSGWIDATDTPVLYTVDADGSNQTQISLPNLNGNWIIDLTIDRDGSRAFFMAGQGAHHHEIYKVEGGTVARIFRAADASEIATADTIQTTANGEYVYFLDDGVNDNDVWRVGHAGGTPTKIIEDTDVTNNGYPGAQVAEFAISADAGTIAFFLFGYWDGVCHPKPELFVKDGGGNRQLSSGFYWMPRDVTISGDGNTIVYGDDDTYKWTAIRADGSNKIELEALGYGELGGLTYDGSQMFYRDHFSDGARLISTDGSSRLHLFPRWSPIFIAATDNLDISDDGRRVAFTFEYNAYPYKEALYIGYLNDPDAVPDAPTIHNITFDPASMPRGDANASVTISSQISDQQGLADIERTSTDEMLDGLHEGDSYKLPVFIHYAAHDDGSPPDGIADDGVFSTSGVPAGAIDTVEQMTVRMAAQDASKTVVLADTILLVGEEGGYALFLPHVTR